MIARVKLNNKIAIRSGAKRSGMFRFLSFGECVADRCLFSGEKMFCAGIRAIVRIYSVVGKIRYPSNYIEFITRNVRVILP